MPKPPPRVLAVLPGFIPSTFMNVVKPILALEHSGQVNFQVNLESYLRLEALKWADLVVFCRNTEPIFAPILQAVIQTGIPYIYDLDDNLFEIPLDTDLGRYHRDPQRLALLSRYLAGANLVRVYSGPLAERVLPLNPATTRVEAVVDWQNIRPRKPAGDRPLQIVYATSRQEDTLAQIFLPAVETVLERFPGKVEMNFWGYLPPGFAGRPGVRHLKPLRNYDEFMQQFSSMGFDIGLAPLLDDEFHRSKTNNKFREYSACQIAGIYSDVETYARNIQDGETGLLVENSSQAWINALVALVTDGDFRRKISSQGYAYARQHFSQEALVQGWQIQVESALAKSGEVSAELKTGGKWLSNGEESLPAAGGWYRQRLRRMVGKIGEQTPGSIWEKLTLHASNLWFLYRINVLKHL